MPYTAFEKILPLLVDITIQYELYVFNMGYFMRHILHCVKLLVLSENHKGFANI